jgi:hypothetical protein
MQIVLFMILHSSAMRMLSNKYPLSPYLVGTWGVVAREDL